MQRVGGLYQSVYCMALRTLGVTRSEFFGLAVQDGKISLPCSLQGNKDAESMLDILARDESVPIS